MDIKSLYTLEAHESGSEMNIISPIDGKPTECFLTVSGVDSRAWREAELAGKRKIVDLVKGGDFDEAKHAEIIANTLASAVTGWRGFDDKGKPLDFDRAFLADLLVNSPSIGDQVDSFVATRSNFTKG
tara:strand:+ start:55 stop:438 length:384 start_codon:yes stop_codon:yes gene_type:complete